VSPAALTVDVVALAGRPARSVLLIERRHEPFARRWALPGGFVEEREQVAVAAARELVEETGLDHAAPLALLGVYDTPGRDPRGWTVSVAYLMELPAPVAVEAGDDAGDARWFELDALPPLAFDHATLIADAVSFAARCPRT
jgi:8-oxo-dGTP diphosphatase